MTGHLGLDDLAYLVASDNLPSREGHLAGCEVCRRRLTNLRIRSADVSSALGRRGAVGSATYDIDPMPDDVTLRITAALTAAREVRPADVTRGRPAHPDAAPPEVTPPAVPRPDVSPPEVTRPTELAAARARRSGRLHAWLAAAAAAAIIGGGFGAISHFGGARTTGTDSAPVGASDSGGEALSAGTSPASPSPAANPAAARGVLIGASFTDDAREFIAAQKQLKTPGQATQPLAGQGSNRCATAATGQAAAIAGGKAAGANAAVGSASFVGPVTVDGRAGVLYLVAIGPAKVAVALAGCSSPSPEVLASATL